MKKKCYKCDGRGRIKDPADTFFSIMCPACKGKGYKEQSIEQIKKDHAEYHESKEEVDDRHERAAEARLEAEDQKGEEDED